MRAGGWIPAGGAARAASSPTGGTPPARYDFGYVEGVNVLDLGLYRFYEQVRGAIPAEKILLVDAGAGGSFRNINGVESEGFPKHIDCGMDTWSSGLNLLLFARERSLSPDLSYVNLSFSGGCGDMPASASRLGMGAAMCVDAAVTFAEESKIESGGGPITPDVGVLVGLPTACGERRTVRDDTAQ